MAKKLNYKNVYDISSPLLPFTTGRLLLYFGKLYNKQHGPRSGLIWVHTVYMQVKTNLSLKQKIAADDIRRQHFKVHHLTV